jgi:large subunit ribosomal protein L29
VKPSEVREKSEKELRKLSEELEEQIFRLRFQKGSGQLKKTSDLRKTRRDLARVKTVLRQRQPGAGKEAG